MEILLWLVPAVAVTVVAMLGVAWWGRPGRLSGSVDRDEAVRRLGEALTREGRELPGYAVASRDPEPTSGVALRASTSRPVVIRGESADSEAPAGDAAGDAAGHAPGGGVGDAAADNERTARDRRAS